MLLVSSIRRMPQPEGFFKRILSLVRLRKGYKTPQIRPEKVAEFK